MNSRRNASPKPEEIDGFEEIVNEFRHWTYGAEVKKLKSTGLSAHSDGVAGNRFGGAKAFRTQERIIRKAAGPPKRMHPIDRPKPKIPIMTICRSISGHINSRVTVPRPTRVSSCCTQRECELS